MQENEIKQLESEALRVRERVINLATDGGCFLGASLSCVDLIVYMYRKFLNVTKETLNDPNRDYFLLSKGHDVPALYGMFTELGFIDESRLQKHLDPSDSVYWHPNRSIPGVEFHSGSLGHLLSVAAGIAYDCRMRKANNKIVVVVGDGELNEGTNWETLLVANALKLDNLLVIVDRNHFQANIRTEELIPLEPMEDKFRAFGAQVRRINGHSYAELDACFTDIDFISGGPKVVIADTVRGKGLPSIEERADRWFCNFSKEEISSLLQELHGADTTKLTSETLTVR